MSRKWLLDSLLFSLIQLDVSLSCHLEIRLGDLSIRRNDLLRRLAKSWGESALLWEKAALHPSGMKGSLVRGAEKGG